MARARARTRNGARDLDEDPREYAHLKRLFLRAVALGEEERGRFLDEACEGQPHLRAEVESLLQYHFETVTTSDEPSEAEG